jgi:hypothetical protein
MWKVGQMVLVMSCLLTVPYTTIGGLFDGRGFTRRFTLGHGWSCRCTAIGESSCAYLTSSFSLVSYLVHLVQFLHPFLWLNLFD